MLRELGLEASKIIVTVRPPATEAHYHNPEAEVLLERFMARACADPRRPSRSFTSQPKTTGLSAEAISQVVRER